MRDPNMDGTDDSSNKPPVGPDARPRGLVSALRKRVARPFFLLGVLALGLFLGGFIVFSDHVSTMQTPEVVEPADGIVVLTGGYSRIEGALDLLKDKRGKRLFISGVHPSTKRGELQRVTRGDATLFECCVDIDRSALDTIGNASESIKWAKANHYTRVIVVTNNYHMPRTLVELRRASQDIEFIPYPIVNSDLRNGDWLARGQVVRVLVVEYVKYLGAIIRSTLPDNLSAVTQTFVRWIKGDG